MKTYSSLNVSIFGTDFFVRATRLEDGDTALPSTYFAFGGDFGHTRILVGCSAQPNTDPNDPNKAGFKIVTALSAAVAGLVTAIINHFWK